MTPFITQTGLKLIKKLSITLIFCLGTIACDDDARSRLDTLAKAKLVLPSGKTISVFVAQTDEQQQIGLSGLMPGDFEENESMIFPGDFPSVRQFWMPDTHFDLDIFFLNKDLYVLDVHRNVPHFPKREPRSKVPLSKAVYSQHVLEIKSSSDIAKEIKPGMMLKWSGDSRLLQTK